MILPLKQEKNYRKNKKKKTAIKTRKESADTSQTLFKTANKAQRV